MVLKSNMTSRIRSTQAGEETIIGSMDRRTAPAEPPHPPSGATQPLNPAQQEAVRFGEGPLLIIAGAGTGKTLVLTHRIAHLITDKRARPEEILALTFTERAAQEMEERVDQLVPYGYMDVRISTFHAFGDRLLRDHALLVGIPSSFQVLTRPEQLLFLRHHLFA